MSLAILGGRPVRTKPFPSRVTIGDAEKAAVAGVLDAGVLSAYYGSPGPQFLGGKAVRAMEEKWAQYFGYKHAISLNSWTSGLVACIGALQLEPGDEIICPPLTMSASVIAGLTYGVLPVFADIEPGTFCLDPAAVERAIGPRTRAIMAVHLFGRPANIKALSEIADRHGLVLIEDAAQSPGAKAGGRMVGGLRDLGGFSLNYHKHIHSGEGGVIVTDNDDLALRCQMIRNHGENAWEALGVVNPAGLWGQNFRMSELHAAIASCQLDRLEGILECRNRLAAHFEARLRGMNGITTAATLAHDDRQSHYVYPLLFDQHAVGISRARFIEAVAAELPAPCDSDHWAFFGGYVRPLYKLPLLQQRAGLGRIGFPFNLMERGADYYRDCHCPVAEGLHADTLMVSFLIREPLTESDIDDFADAIEKVLLSSDQLRS